MDEEDRTMHVIMGCPHCCDDGYREDLGGVDHVFCPNGCSTAISARNKHTVGPECGKCGAELIG